jgi:hypothetical protein
VLAAVTFAHWQIAAVLRTQRRSIVARTSKTAVAKKWHSLCVWSRNNKERRSHMGLLLLIILVILILGAAPAWPYSRGWGYYPSGGLGLVLIIVLILVLMNRI